jgi:chitodextrinase
MFFKNRIAGGALMRQAFGRIGFIFLSILLLQVISLNTTYAEKQHTEVGGIIHSDAVWTKDQSPYRLTKDVQISYGSTLVIDPGVVVEGNNHSIQTFGTLEAIGTSTSIITLNDVQVAPGANTRDTPYLIHIEFSDVFGGSIYPPTGHAVYGSLILRDSKLTNTTYLYLWYPIRDVFIERNIFMNAGGISVGTSDDVKVFIRNNVFYQQNSPYEQYAITNWASYSISETIVEYNSFLSTDRIALRLPSGYSHSKMTAANNYWSTKDPKVIESMIYDKRTDLASADYINYSPILSKPHELTPFVDLKPPSWPKESQLTATNIGQTSLTLEWTPATDNVAVSHYRLYKDDTLLATVSGQQNRFQVKNLSPYQTYRFRIEAGDNADNWSSKSLRLSVRTTDTTRPRWPEGSQLTASNIKQTSLTLNWTPATDNAAVSHYRIYLGDELLTTVSGNKHSFTVKDLAPFQSYRFRVEAGDKAGNWSSTSLRLSVNTTDTSSPKWPEDSQLTASNIKQTSMTLSWTPATDNAVVSHYRIYQGDTLLTTVSGSKTSLAIRDLLPSQTYQFRIEAGDKAGNWSKKGPRISVKTL